MLIQIYKEKCHKYDTIWLKHLHLNLNISEDKNRDCMLSSNILKNLPDFTIPDQIILLYELNEDDSCVL